MTLRSLIRPSPLVASAAAVLLISGCATIPDNTGFQVASAKLVSASGTSIGAAKIETHGSGLRLDVTVIGLAPGVHGLHLHATGSCNAPGFTTAGPHLNPDKRQHGTESSGGSHLGDLPNLIVGADGSGTLSVMLPGSALVLEAAILRDPDGTAIVVHAGPDDYRTDPSGNSGNRIACGVFSLPER